MAWIEAHQRLERSHKLHDLMISMDWTKHEAMGRLFVFWWWCVDHAEDGDLKKFNDGHLALAAELSPSEGKRFVDAMVQAGFLDREPYFRIHDWFDYLGTFLRKRHNKNPERWHRVRDLYQGEQQGDLQEQSTGALRENSQENSRSASPNLTKPNLTKPKESTPKPPEGASGPSPHRTRFKPPAAEEVASYFAERGVDVVNAQLEASAFIDHYESNGWMVGRVKMKEWKGAVRNWIRNGEKFKGNQHGNDNRKSGFSRNGEFNAKRADDYAGLEKSGV